jgi:LysM repeat protein
MTYRRIVPFLLIMVSVAGCFRQAEDTFDTVDSQGSTNIGITQVVETTSTPEVLIIDPNATSTEVDAAATEETAATESDVEATPTVRIIQPTSSSTPTNIPLPATQQQQDIVPTATQQTILTPDTGPVQQVIPSATPTTGSSTQSNNGLPPTPTALPGTEGSECEYVIQSGDNLFRIALNNDVTLADLLAANNLSEQSVIQPGQVLVIPGCVGEETAGEETTQAEVEAEPTAALEDGQVIHVVSSGETLLSIARRYGITVNDIVQANTLQNPNNLTVGQELIIPQASDE